jgi:hypothetical protein
MAEFRPTYITFDCYGTLINFQMSHMTRTLFADRLPPDRLPAFTTDFSAYRFDEVLGEWQPYADVIRQALRRCCRRWGLPSPGGAGPGRAGLPARHSVERRRQPDPPQRGNTRRAVPRRVHGRAGAGL